MGRNKIAYFYVEKKGCEPEEYEDAIAIDSKTGRVAIADGATEGYNSGVWARKLVDGFVHADVKALSHGKWISQLQAEWEMATWIPNVDWYRDAKRKEGAFATFLGVCILQNEWTAYAVGDCCLIHYQNNQILATFPMTDGDAFTPTPSLISSRTASGVPGICKMSHTYTSGDWLFLMTDALAAYALSQWKTGQDIWGDFLTISRFDSADDGGREFKASIEAYRMCGLRNDDTTLLIIRL